MGFRTLLNGSDMRTGLVILGMTAVLAAQSVNPAPAPRKLLAKPASAAAKPKPPVALARAVVVFHTNGAAKAANTLVSVYVLRKDGYAAAMKQSIADASDQIELKTFIAVKADLSKFRILINPKAEDNWRFQLHAIPLLEGQNSYADRLRQRLVKRTQS